MISHILPIFIFGEVLLVPSKSIESVVRRDIIFFFKYHDLNKAAHWPYFESWFFSTSQLWDSGKLLPYAEVTFLTHK